MKFSTFLSKFPGARKQGKQWLAKCPAHDDQKPSLSIAEGADGRLLLKCQASCAVESVCAAVGLTTADLFTAPKPKANNAQRKIAATYDYFDSKSRLVLQAVRFEPKRFSQRRPDGSGNWVWGLSEDEYVQSARGDWYKVDEKTPTTKTRRKFGECPRVLYRLRELLATDPSTLVFIPEGEKDVERLRSLGLVATCNAMGAGKWRDEYNEPLRARAIVIVEDNDKAGREHALQVARSLHGVATSVKVLRLSGLPDKGDVSDWLDAGGTVEQLLEIVAHCPEWSPASEATSVTAEPAEESEAKRSIAIALIELALSRAELFHDSSGDCFASVEVSHYRQTYKLGSRDFKDWLARLLYAETGKAASSDKLSEALTVLRAKARYEAPEIETHVRVAEHAGAIYLDLCDRNWRQIEITTTNWRIVEAKDSPIRFRRAGGTLALPEPIRGGELGELRALLNLPAEDKENWPLILGWLVATFKPANETRFAYPLLAIHGEQGSAKSSTCRLLRRLVDPNKADLRSTPKDERDLAIAAEHGRVLAFDNLTHLSESLSNALCRLATGGGFATRELFTDEGEVIFDAQRPVILNGISEVVTKSDLLDRSILIYLPQIPKTERKLDRVIEREFATVQPRVLGALCNVVSVGLRNLARGVELDELPRLADFAEWVCACAEGLGFTSKEFLDAYSHNQEKANGLAIEASPVAAAVLALLAEAGDWQGEIGGLLKALNNRLEANSENPKKKLGWPQSPRGLSAKLKELAPNLRRSGVEVGFGERTKRGYTLTLSQVAKEETRKEGKDVHQVHQVHQPNRLSDLASELSGALLEIQPTETCTSENGKLTGEHLNDHSSPKVHHQVHPVSSCKQMAGELGELGEHPESPIEVERRKVVRL